MTPILNWLARRLWYLMLWTMRRPPIKRLRLTFPKYLPPSQREKAWQSFRNQERFARKYGLTLTRWIVGIVLFIFLFQLIGAGVYWMYAEGLLSLPEGLQ